MRLSWPNPTLLGTRACADRQFGKTLRMAIAAATALLAGNAYAQPSAGPHHPGPPHAFQTHQLAPNIYWVEGGGGNSGILVGVPGVVIFDTKTTAQDGEDLLSRVSRVTPKPINAVILSHSDPDHVGGLRAFPHGLRIIAQQAALQELKKDLASNPATALPAIDFPTETVLTREDVVLDGFTIRLLHWSPAHTGGDMVLYLPKQKILFCGDLITPILDHPVIHPEKHGTSAGWIASVEGMLKLDVIQYVPGHGDVMTRAGIEKMVHDAESERAEIGTMIGQGKSLAEIEAATGDPSPNEKLHRPFAPFAEIVYNEMTGRPR